MAIGTWRPRQPPPPEAVADLTDAALYELAFPSDPDRGPWPALAEFLRRIVLKLDEISSKLDRPLP